MSALRVALTGGGTAGHVVPNLVLAAGLAGPDVEIVYIGQRNGVERQMALAAGLPFYGIPAGKLRRYLSWENVKDVFRVVLGVLVAWRLLGRLRPQVVFSKGGFVAFPVVAAAAARGIPVVAHESDLTPGLATRLCLPLVTRVLTAFPDTVAALRHRRCEYLGMPLRHELLHGDRAAALQHCGFEADPRRTLLVIGGSQGARAINLAVRADLGSLLRDYRVVHLTGPGNVDSAAARPGYVQFEYVSEGLGDLFALADVVISRAGATTLFELIALRRAHVLVPLPRAGSRGDQLANAALTEAAGISVVLPEDSLSGAALGAAVEQAWAERGARGAAMESWLPGDDPAAAVLAQLVAVIRAEAHS